MPQYRPSEVRALMMSECESLRAALNELSGTAERSPQMLRAGIVDLRDRLRDYLRHEQELLLPALAATDHGGPGRLARMRAAHAAHYIAIEELAREAQRPDADTGMLAAGLAILRSKLRHDLDEDERCLLGSEILQDDECGCDQTDG